MIPSFKPSVTYAIRYPSRWITIRVNCWNTIGYVKNVTEIVWLAARWTILNWKKQALPNQSLQPTANPLRGLSAAELGRYAIDTVGTS